MKKFVAMLAVGVIVMSCALCSAAERTGILIIAPVEFKSQDFMKIATKTFGKDYNISQGTQDAWATYCWDKGLTYTDVFTTKETLADFATTTDYDKIIFIIFKETATVTEDRGATFNASPLFGGVFGNVRRRVRHRSALEARVVIMNHDGETLKVFEETHTDASKASELRANRGAFKGLCRRISDRLSGKAK